MNYNSLRQRTLTSVSAAALLASFGMGTPARAQESAQTAQVEIEQVVVTGTRIIRDGFEAPTPVTVIDLNYIQDEAAGNIIDFIAKLPALIGSELPETQKTSMTRGGVGLSTPEARNLGASRTLILLDGRRSVASQQTGDVDVNTFPQQLVTRVDVVTGGASAAYGSDALAGVVNFVLNRNFTGFKAEVQGGITTYGDGPEWKGSFAFGTPFANDRGHFLMSAEIANRYGIEGAPRDWAKEGWHTINNPAYAVGNGEPQRIITDRASVISMAPGGIVVSGPLAGLTFGEGGEPRMFNYGEQVKYPWHIGGEWAANDLSHDGSALLPEDYRHNAFFRGSYEITDNTEIFAELSYASSHTYSICCNHFAGGRMQIQVDNAFMDEGVRAKMVELGLQTIKMGSHFSDLPFKIEQETTRIVRRYVVGAEGDFDAFGTNWTWDAYFQVGSAGITKSFYDRSNSGMGAIDAVRSPTTGGIVCRSTLTNPNDGCVPWNVFGLGVNGPAAANFTAHWSYAYETVEQQVASSTFAGEPFTTWAGPVSVALGVEYRNEKVGGIQSAANAANNSFVGNAPPTVGSYNVTEGFVETVIPLATDVDWAESLEFNGAIRATSYSTAGYVTTWKAGLTYSPITDITFRGTYSRDIRAPQNVELFSKDICVGNLVLDPFNNGLPVNVQGCESGNLDLVPEKADTTGFGIVLQPSFMPGLSTSIDFFNIKIKDAIGKVGRQQTPDRCFNGEKIFCSALVFDAEGFLSRVNIRPTNFVKETMRGIDSEIAYTTPMDAIVGSWDGTLTLRALATVYIKQEKDQGTGAGIVNTIGSGDIRKWNYRFTGTYVNDPFRFTLTGRGVNSGVRSVSYFECTTGCPLSKSTARTVNNNFRPAALYLDGSLRYKFDVGSSNAEAFLAVRNILDKDPPPGAEAQGPGGVAHSVFDCAAEVYDCVGRTFRAGIRWEM
jgi:iron complex outermembrane receptor protein